MGWFGLFDLLRFRPGYALQEGWPLPSSQLRITDANLASLYHGAVAGVGQGFHADLYDIATHHLACSSQPHSTAWHVDVRLTGRPTRLLFATDPRQPALSWHAASRTATVRMVQEPGVPADPLRGHETILPACDLLRLLEETLPVEQIATLSVWVEVPQDFETLMRQIEPWLTRDTRAMLRLPSQAVPDTLARLMNWPARCAALAPCTQAPDRVGRGETASDVIFCLEELARQTPDEARLRALPASSRPQSWNDQDRAVRTAPQGGVSMRPPAEGFADKLAQGLAVDLLGDVPISQAGAAMAAIQATPYRAQPGFDYLLDIAAARIVVAADRLFVVPQSGPMVLDPQRLREADRPVPAAPDSLTILMRAGLPESGPRPSGPVARLSDRVGFLLGDAGSALDHITQQWPNLDHLFRFCERERIPLTDVDILVPPAAGQWVEQSLALIGIDPGQVRRNLEDVLYRRLLLASPASDAASAQRSPAYDRFWRRLAAFTRQAGLVSFCQPRPTGRVMLVRGEPTDGGLQLANEGSLAQLAQARGYRLMAADATPITTVQAILAEASAVVADSALLGWTCLAQGCGVGLLHSSSARHLPHAALHAAAARGHHVLGTFGTSVGQGPGAGFIVAPDRFSALLDRIEGRGFARQQAPVPAEGLTA